MQRQRLARYAPPAPEPTPADDPSAVLPLFCIDCQRAVSEADAGHQHHQRVPQRELGADSAGPASLAIDLVGEGTNIARVDTGAPGLNLVLGGGLVTNSIVMLAGEPGCGKTTLLSAVAGHLAGHGRNALYCSGEETEKQVAALARRIGVAVEGVRVLHTDSLEEIEREVRVLAQAGFHLDLLIVDSAQAIGTSGAAGAVGSAHQVSEVTSRLRRLAKKTGIAVIMVYQINKQGDPAGPKNAEHAVDVRLDFGKDDRDVRYLRCVKNRFGASGEVSQFEMTPKGLRDARDPTFVLWTELLSEPGVSGFVAAHLARPVILPVEASVTDSDDPGAARIVQSTGFPLDRLKFLLEAMGQHTDLALGKRSVRLRVPEVAGEVVKDVALDLAVVAAVWGAAMRRVLVPLYYWGEVGLSGRVTAGPKAEGRLRCAAAVKGPLRGVVVGDRAGLTSGVMRVHAVKHLRDLPPVLEALSSAADGRAVLANAARRDQYRAP